MRVRKIASAISEARQGAEFDLIIAHGAGAYGHQPAKKYDAMKGIHPEYGWKGYYQIRAAMTQMNLRFVGLCQQENLYPVTIQPASITLANRGHIESMYLSSIQTLLDFRQIPLLHGDIVLDKERGFTIASTEDLLIFLSEHLVFKRIIMLSDVEGVLDKFGQTIPIIDRNNFNEIDAYLGDARGIDVTGGMRQKVNILFKLVQKNHSTHAFIVSGSSEPGKIRDLILGSLKGDTYICNDRHH